MLFLARTLPTPAENLALDEALLDHAEAAPGFAALRVYEAPAPFVVVGYGNAIRAEVNVAACGASGIPVLRRCSGGGTVVLGPGCLGYALVLPLAGRPELATITDANRWIMRRHADALSRLLGRPVEVEGHTDLVAEGRKFSGNAQRRRRGALLFHGTLLCRFDLGLVTRLLRHPTVEPAYREGRPHESFVANLEVPPALLAAALATEWGATPSAGPDLSVGTAALVAAQYGSEAWVWRGTRD
ncbi:MAG: biotin/lipoate A/B protein ligase family protein [Limisphaerales bacterium]